MSDKPKDGPPEPVRNIVEAIVNQALARCDRMGIAWEDFDKAMAEESRRCPQLGLPELIEQTFRRVGRAAS